MITVKEIAKMCDVSPSTVSNILNGKTNVSQKTRERVLEVIAQTGYQPNFFASNMRKQSTRTIGIIAEDFRQFSTTPIVEAAIAYLDDHNYRTLSMNLRLYDKWQDTWYNDEHKINSVLYPVLNEMQSIKVDGVIYVAGHCRTIKNFPESYNLPTVMAYGTAENDKFPSVILDDEQGGYEMMKYLIEKGHRKIGIVAGAPDNIHATKRLVGCQKALFEAGIPYNPKLTVNGDWERPSGYASAEELIQAGVTAIWAMNDQMAGGLYDYCREHNIEIGRDISVAGYDNLQISEYMYPKLTTNELPLRQIGVRTAEMLLQMLEQGQETIPAGITRISGEMQIRDSVISI